MACGCSRGRRSVTASAQYTSFTYEVTLPGEEQPQEYLTALEAKRAVRRAGGGTIRRKGAA